MPASSVGSSSILGQYENGISAATGGATDRVATDKDTFLKLLVAQLSHQDPLNPQDDKEFVAQLAQFTSVEELQNINAGITSLNAAYGQQQVATAASFLGTAISAKGDMVTRSGNYSSTLYATFPEDVANGTITVTATDADGNPTRMVFSEAFGSMQAGTVDYTWSGKDNTGKDLPDGSYIVTFSAKDYEGNDVLVSTNSEGVVTGVETSPDGNHFLYLNDGRKVRFNDVELITSASMGAPGAGSDAGSGDESGDSADTETDPGETDETPEV